MTHGCGSLSTGTSSVSGSSFSWSNTAVLSAAANSSNRNSNRNSSDDDCDECCVCCIDLICTGLAYLFCIKQMTKFTRIVLTWFWVLTFSVVANVVLAVGVFGLRDFAAAPTDMRVVSEAYSTFMCDGLKLNSSSIMNTYLMPGPPQIDQERREIYNMTTTMSVPSDTYEYWGFYMLAGSRITVESCATKSMYLNVIKGRDNLDDWIDDNTCFKCVLKKIFLPGQFICFSFPGSSFTKYSLVVLDSEEYYFVYEGSNTFDSNLDVKFYLNRSTYDLTSATKRIMGRSKAFFELDYQSPQVVVYHTLPGGSRGTTVSMHTNCMPRIAIYFAFFVFPPLVLGVFLTILIRKKCTDPTGNSSRRQTTPRRPQVRLRNEGPRTPLVTAAHGRGRTVRQQPLSATNLMTNPIAEEEDAPPKYEDIERQKQEAPPTYEDSLKQLNTRRQ